jgi:uncharacterized protein (DUF488 family)
VATLFTVGHGRLDRAQLGALLGEAGIARLVDIRRFPGSRANPDVSRDVLSQWLPDFGIDYQWEERLGGRRRLPAGAEAEDSWWRVDQFAAYAAHTRTPEFAAALDEVLARPGPTAVMCSEAVWWRCHRRLVADVVVLARGGTVHHLMHDGRTVEHTAAEGGRVRKDGDVVWDGR